MTFRFHDTVPVDTGTVSVAFTDRSLDLGDLAPDGFRGAALAALAEATGATPYLMHQVHGSDIHVVDDPAEPRPDADGLVTSRAGIALLARAADCVPVLLVARTGEIGAVHAGREGVRRGVVSAAVERLVTLGATDLRAWVGPHICGSCYEVPDRMRTDVATAAPATHATTSWGTPGLDLGAGVVAELGAAGIPVVEVGGCTREDDTLHSHRRDGAAAGRLAGVVWRTP
ncbi:polyphenol oxidase family protein [Nocardioides sp. YIM 152315]|uniref:polyphenol oxidase family protein n=1 Tax=Nocardioides sp. YIM 152315 TaxID=3031760 RepID=UPI0023DB5918|nr:polyphenol oxidase family protein [Nocardioides sp. YIM 152315]MDF1603077.1 polyphenol oxidase family protein [Nocardioides sp. YIM 152315]